jgi:DNA-binding MarR family transcriptional regulator
MEETATQEEFDRIADWRQRHIGRLFLRAHRDFSERALEKLSARGHGGLGLAHTTLLPHLDLDGTRITTLAERAGITKQAVGQLVADLEQRGYVARAVDPTDRRATLVFFTEDGRRFLRDAEQIKYEIEAEYAAILGAERLDALREALVTLLDHARTPG